MTDNPHMLQFAATNDSVREALKHLRAGMVDRGLSQELCDTAEVVLAEVLNNVVEHATPTRTGGMVRLSTTYRPPVLECELCDNGVAMPGYALPDGEPPGLGATIDDLPEGGFGWHLIRALVQDIDYRRDAGWNCLRFRLSD